MNQTHVLFILLLEMPLHFRRLPISSLKPKKLFDEFDASKMSYVPEP